jgi:hypothetical protein
VGGKLITAHGPREIGLKLAPANKGAFFGAPVRGPRPVTRAPRTANRAPPTAHRVACRTCRVPGRTAGRTADGGRRTAAAGQLRWAGQRGPGSRAWIAGHQDDGHQDDGHQDDGHQGRPPGQHARNASTSAGHAPRYKPHGPRAKRPSQGARDAAAGRQGHQGGQRQTVPRRALRRYLGEKKPATRRA